MSSMRRALGLESVQNETFASSDEANDTAGFDLTELIEDVDNVQQLGQLEAAEPVELSIATNDYGSSDRDFETVCSVVEVLEQSGDKGVNETALAVAQETISNIFQHRGIVMRAPAAEAISGGRAVMTKEVISIAQEGLGDMLKSAAQAIVNTSERMRVNVRNAFRFRTAWRKDAMELRKLAQTRTGVPKEGARYTKRVRIAHMTLGDQTVITSAEDMHNYTLSVHNGLTGVVRFLTGLTSLFAWFNSEKGKVDFDKIADNFKPSKYNKGMLSVSGADAIFGEEVVISDFGGMSDNVDKMMAIMRRIHIELHHVWRVKDLDDDLSLPAASIADIRRSSETLVRLGDEVVDLYNRYDREMGKFLMEQYNRNQDGIDLDMIVSPIRYFRYKRQYMRLLNGMIGAVNHTFDLNMKAATCLLDYYKWSVANNH